MDSVAVQIANAVKNELNAQSFSQTFTAECEYLPVFELAEMKTLHVTVVPKSATYEIETRGLRRGEFAVDIAVQKKADRTNLAEIGGLMYLVQEIADVFVSRRLSQLPEAVWVRTENDPIYSPEHLDKFHQFTSVLTLTFRVMRR